TESDREGKLICYQYLPKTNLLTSEFFYEGNTIRKRTFHTYDDCACCIQTIVDDGSSTKPDDLTNVTCRKITEIKPKQSTPCYGLPEIVEEKTIDASGKEILLKKVAYTYTPFGKVLTEKHYDSEGTHHYTITNIYDAS